MPEHDAATVAFLKALGVEIRSWRMSRNLTRAALAGRAGISETTMGRIEREGPVDVGDTWKLAAALGVGFSDLVRRAEDKVRLQNVIDEGKVLIEQKNRELNELERKRAQRSLSAGDPNVEHLVGEPSAAQPEPTHDVEGDRDPEET